MNEQEKTKSVVASRVWIPNLFTGLRIVGAFTLIFLPPMGTAFYVVYALCGVSDVLDGCLARHLKATSAFGAKLDSAADLSFYAVALLRLLPQLRRRLPVWIWYFVGLVLAIRLSGYLIAAIRLKKFASLHSIANKITGAGVFGVGIVMQFSWLTPYCIVVVILGLLSSSQELIYHLRSIPKAA